MSAKKKFDHVEAKRLREQDPKKWSYRKLAQHFNVSASAVYFQIHDGYLDGRRPARKTKRQDVWDKEKAINAAREFYEWVGRTPTARELGTEGTPPRNTIQRLFGSVNNYYREAGLPLRQPGRQPDMTKTNSL